MKVIARTTMPEYEITAGKAYEVEKEIKSPEIGLLYRLINDTQKPTNLRAIHFRRPDELPDAPPLITSELIDLHRRQYKHNRELLVTEFNELLARFIPPHKDDPVNIADVSDFLDDAKGYLLAMMFHSGSLRCVGIDLGTD